MENAESIQSNTAIVAAIQSVVQEGRISCAQTFAIAEKFSVLPIEVGKVINFLEIKISKCQLGLFGYGKGVKLIKPAASIPHTLEKELKEAIVKNTISCKKLWEIADALCIPRLEVACGCEKLKVKIIDCQLGGF